MDLDNYIAIDTETTGLDPVQDRVIEIAIVGVVQGQVADRFSKCLDPGRPVSDEITALTGITNDELRGADTFGAVAEAVEIASDAGACAYNANFDKGMLNAELARIGRPALTQIWLDPFVLAKACCAARRFDRGYRLGEVMTRLKAETGQKRHRALGDVLTTIAVVAALRPYLPPDFADVLWLQQVWLDRQTAWYGPDDRRSRPTWTLASSRCEWTIPALDQHGAAETPFDCYVAARRAAARSGATGWFDVDVTPDTRRTQTHTDRVLVWHDSDRVKAL